MTSDAETVATMVAKELARQEIYEHELAVPLIRFGPTWVMLIGPHADEMCWCQPSSVLCPYGAHSHVIEHIDRIH